VVRMNVETDSGVVTVEGILLAQTSSRRFNHAHRGNHVPSGQRCSACRWTRITILRRENPDDDRPYAVVVEGFSLLPGERTIGRVECTSSPLWVIECLHRRNKAKEKYISVVARNALLMATQYDKALAAECERREIGC
jgi:hypothetical protein